VLFLDEPTTGLDPQAGSLVLFAWIGMRGFDRRAID